MSRKEGQPGTPEKPLSDLGRVSYHAYWKSVTLEYLHKHRPEDIRLTNISKETGMYCHDIATALQSLGFVKIINGKASLCIDWEKVNQHAERVAKSKTRIPIDPECLRWTPLLTTTVNPFREEKSDGEKENEAITQQTADIIIPVPEKIIIETQRGVKMRKGRKRKISSTRKTPKTPRNEKVTPVVPEIGENATTEEQEVEVTSSGRRRTRPSKFNETTYADVKLKPHTENNKRKRNESATSEADGGVEKKKQKTDMVEKQKIAKKTVVENPVPETPKMVKNDVSETPTSTAVTRSRRSGVSTEKVTERWSQRRKRLQNNLKAKEQEMEVKEVAVEQPTPAPPPPSEVIAEPSVDEKLVAPSLELKRMKNRKKKRGWVKGRTRRATDTKQQKQLTLPEFIKRKQESENDSIPSDKSDDETTNKKESGVPENNLLEETPPPPPPSQVKLNEETTIQPNHLNTDEDSSAEADDEMENDELTPKQNSTSPKKYKYTSVEEKREEEETKMETSEVVAVVPENKIEEVPIVDNKNEPPVIENSNEKVIEQVVIVETETKNSESSESETEIDGHKIKTISQKEVLELSKEPPTIEKEIEKPEETHQKMEVVVEKPVETEKSIVEIPKVPEVVVVEDRKTNEKEEEVIPKVESAPVTPVVVEEPVKKPVEIEKVEPKIEEKQKKSVATETDSKLLLDRPEKKPKTEIKPQQESVKPKDEVKLLPKQESSPPKIESKPPKLDDKRYQQKYEDLKPKPPPPPLENETLLTKPEFAMTTAPSYMPQAQYQWQWWDKGLYFDPKRDYQGYPPMPLHHIPPIDVLPPKQHPPPTEREKSALKAHRHESKQVNRNKEIGKSPPKKDEKAKMKIESETPPKPSEQHNKKLPSVDVKPAEEKVIVKSSNVTGTHKSNEIVEESMQMSESVAPPVVPSIKHTPPTPSDIPSMGVYTPDSTTNSVHSLHYGQCDIEIGQLGLESPTSISSDMASQNSVEAVRPPSVISQQHTPQQQQQPPSTPQQQQQPPPPSNYDCSVQQHTLQPTMQVQQNITVPASSPNVSNTPMQMPQNQNNPSKRQLQQQRRANTPKQSVRSTPPVQQGRQRTTPPTIQSHQHMQASPTAVQHQGQHNIAVMQQHHQQQLQHIPHQVAMHQGYGHHPQLGGSAMHQHGHHPHHHSVISQGNYIPVPQVGALCNL